MGGWKEACYIFSQDGVSVAAWIGADGVTKAVTVKPKFDFSGSDVTRASVLLTTDQIFKMMTEDSGSYMGSKAPEEAAQALLDYLAKT